ncbi:hypothetical protein [Pantoea agglomerans]|uniref:hypothetical protein n=1 Tax=Enterobacter agglomerans TaxID=549 RepID=UPI0024138289|nr:hypothetical protein [Pantoea agglomerans]
MPNTVKVEPNSTATLYYKDTPVIPESEPAITIKNNGPSNDISITSYWAAPLYVGGWHVLNEQGLKVGETVKLDGGAGPFYHFKVEARNNFLNASAELEVSWD